MEKSLVEDEESAGTVLIGTAGVGGYGLMVVGEFGNGMLAATCPVKVIVAFDVR